MQFKDPGGQVEECHIPVHRESRQTQVNCGGWWWCWHKYSKYVRCKEIRVEQRDHMDLSRHCNSSAPVAKVQSHIPETTLARGCDVGAGDVLKGGMSLASCMVVSQS